MKETKSENGCSSMEEMLKDSLQGLQEKIAKEGWLGISSGFRPLDDLTDGFENGKVYVIGGKPCMGKEEFMLSVIDNIVQKSQLPVLLFSTKKLKSEYFSRFLSIHCDIPTLDLNKGRLEPHLWKKLDEGIHTLDYDTLFIRDSLGISLEELIETTRKSIKEKDISIVFIDCLQMIDIGNENGSPSERTANVMRSLKQLAIQENLPIIVGTMLANFTGYDEDYDYRRPELTNLPDSSFIGELADVVIFAHRPEYYHIYTDEHGEDLRGIMQIIVRKNGFKPLGEFNFNYKQETGAVFMIEDTDAPTYSPIRIEDLMENKAVRNLIRRFDLEEFFPFKNE